MTSFPVHDGKYVYCSPYCDCILQTFCTYLFQENNYIEVQTPILTSNDCEGAGEVFQVKVPPLLRKEFYLFIDLNFTPFLCVM